MRRFFPRHVFSALVVFSICAALPLLGAGVVTNASQADLQTAMAGGGTVNLAFNGTITLTNTITVATSTALIASNQSVTISGNNAVQLFVVPQSVTFVLSNLVLANGLAVGAGGAISNTGTVQITGCLFTNNGAEGQAAGVNAGPPIEFPGQGGAIFNAGLLVMHNALFVSNWAEGGTSVTAEVGQDQVTADSPGQGGAIFNAGALFVTNVSFLSNRAEGGSGDLHTTFIQYYDEGQIGGDGNGGAIYNASYALIDICLFNANSAIGGLPGAYACAPAYSGNYGPGAAGSDASGGAIYNDSTIQISDSIIVSNNCTASPGGDSCSGADENPGPDLPGGAGGEGSGAGLFSVSGSVSLSGSTFLSNVAFGGNGGATSQNYDASIGGSGGGGGQASGGGVSIGGGTFSIVNCTFVSNTILAGIGNLGGDGFGGSGGNGGNGGNAAGGAICASGGFAWLTNVTFVGNVATLGGGGQGGQRGGANGLPGVVEGNTVALGPGVLSLLDSILSCASGKTNAFGPIIDAGYNLNSDATRFLTNSTSFNGVDPKLGTLGNYGGPTPTVPLLPGSIAIDHADPTNFPPTDQRGYPRPFGAAPDIGAFEYWPFQPNSLSASVVSNGMFGLVFWGTNGQRFTTRATSDLRDWVAISTNTIAASNSFEMFLPMNDAWTFYQTISQ
jgi:hypothetical protein